ncbi:hypothetical protein [Treponema sp.]|uniref:hypothetical protein n=1 Tax=Treponema sp. TaxID=166 RepID=UPI003F0BB4D7
MGKKMQDEAREIWKAFREKTADEREIKNRLMEFTFRRKYELGLGKMNEDEFSDFLIYMAEHFIHVIKKYNPQISDFSTYITNVLQFSSAWRSKKMFIASERKSVCESMAVEESCALWSEDEAEYCEDNLTTEQLSELARKNLGYSPERREFAPRTKKDGEKFMRELCLVLALKSCFSMTDPLLEKVCAATGYSKERLSRMIMQARESLEKKEKRMQSLLMKRNFAYLHRKKISMQNEKKGELGTEHEKRLYESHDKRWKRSLEELSRQLPVPSNITVGKLLSMPPRKVASLVSRAKKILSDSEQ